MQELEDFPFFPHFLRRFQTGFIGYFVVRFNIYRPFIEYISSLSIPRQEMRDLCSGSGEPAVSIFRESNSFTNLILSDKYPEQVYIKRNDITYLPGSLDVLEMEFQPGSCYTMFNAYHHFSDKQKLLITRKLCDAGASGFIVEILEPDVFCFLKVLFVTTAGNLLLTPFMRPFSISRIFLTYIIPVNILTITYDGLVSVFKSRTEAAYEKTFFRSRRQD